MNNLPWVCRGHIVPFGACCGRRVDLLMAGRSYKEDAAKVGVPKNLLNTLCHEAENPEIPVLLQEEALNIPVEDVNMISLHRPLWVCQDASMPLQGVKRVEHRIVLAMGDSFYNMKRLSGDELIVDVHDEGLLSQTEEFTDFTDYFIMIDDKTDTAYAREFLSLPAGRNWRLTQRCFTEVGTAELERMFNE